MSLISIRSKIFSSYIIAFFLLLYTPLVFSVDSNLIENGSFEEHGKLNNGNWGYLRNLPGWKLASGFFEIQNGDTAGLAAFDGDSKLELDSIRNSSVYVRLDTVPERTYVLSIYYSPRIEINNTNTNDITIWWDGQKISTLTGDKKGWVRHEFELTATSNVTELQLTASGKSDSRGGLIDNVHLSEVDDPEPPVTCEAENLLVNGSFEDFGDKLENDEWGWLKKIPGWQANRGFMEIQRGNVAGILAQDGKAKLELDSKYNSRAYQLISLPKEKEDYALTLNYSPRITTNKATNQIKVVWNNKVIATLSGKDKGWKEYRYEVLSRKSGKNHLELRAAGKSDSFGGLLDNLSLTKKECEGSSNQPPVALPLSLETEENKPLDFSVSTSDPENDPLTFAVVTQPEYGTLSGTGPQFTYKPEPGYHGADDFTYQVNDGSLDSNIATVSITVTETNKPPVITSVPVTLVVQNKPYQYTVTGSDPNPGDVLSFSLITAPEGMAIDPITGVIAWEPDTLGEYEVVVGVSDGVGEQATQSFSVLVKEPNKPPVIISEPITEATQNTPYEYTVVATDPNESDELTFSLTTAPDGMTIDPATGVIAWTPVIAGSFEVVVEIADGEGERVTQSFTVIVAEPVPAEPPEITTEPVASANEGQSYQYDVDAVDPDGTDLAYSVDFSVNGADIDADSGVFNSATGALEVQSVRERNLSCRTSSPELGSFDPVIKWEWNKGGVLSHPMVAPLQDTNGDGVINTDDDEAIVFVEWTGDFGYSKFHVVDGKTGAPIWSSANHIGSGSSVAIGDIDADGIPEIVGVKDGGGTVVYNNDGTVKWVSTYPVSDSQRYDQGAPTIADLEGDGYAEILLRGSVLNYDGSLRFRHPDRLWHIVIDVAADLDGDGFMEVLSQDRAFDYQGNELWRIPDGNWARSFVLVNVDDDEFPEIAYSTSRGAQLLDNDGTQIWKHHASSGRNPTSLTAGDLNGDGKVELIGLLDQRLRVLDAATGDEIWSDASVTDSSHITSAAVFDFEGDGLLEVVYGDSQYLRVYDGLTGEVRYSIANPSVTATEAPAVADVDGDGHAEIIVSTSSSKGIRVIEDKNDSWVATRQLWNQYAYNINNINDDLSIPPNPEKSWLTHNTFRMNTFPDRHALGIADLALYDLRLDESNGTAIRLLVSNRGLAPTSATATVNIYNGNPDQGGVLLGTLSAPTLAAGGEQELVLEGLDASQITTDLYARIDENNQITECLDNNNDAFAALYQVRVTDETGLFDTQRFTITVENVNEAPQIITESLPGVTAASVYEAHIEANDPDVGDGLRYQLVSGPAGLKIDQISGGIRWTVSDAENGAHVLVVRVVDLGGLSAEKTYQLTVGLNNQPVISSDPLIETIAGQAYSYQVQATDQDNDPLVYSLSTAPTSMAIDPDSGAISWTPTTEQAGTHIIEVLVSDNVGGEARQSYVLTVTAPANQPPEIISSPDNPVSAGRTYTYQVLANDPDGDSLEYSLLTAPSGMVVDAVSGLLQWQTTDPDDVGDHPIVIRVADDRGAYFEQSYTLTVTDAVPNTAPTLTSTPSINAVTDQLYQYSIVATDAQNDPLTYELVTAPVGMIIDTTGVISWTPGTADLGSHEVSLKVSDGQGGETSQTYTLIVSDTPVNNKPVINSQPLTTGMVDVEYVYQLSATDADNDALSYSLIQGPAGLTLSADGLIAWTPDSEQSTQVRVQVADGSDFVEQSWTIVVSPNSNELMVQLSVSPQYVDAGELVTIQVTPVNTSDPFNVELKIDGQVVPLDAAYRAEVTATNTGSYSVEVSVTDDSGTVVESATYSVRDPNDTAAPVVSITSPIDLATLTTPSAVVGSVSDDNLASWRLVYKASGSAQDAFAVMASGTAEQSAQTLASFDPTLLQNGQYDLVLEATDVNGQTAQSVVTVTVEGDMKVGNFSITLKDLEIPVAGIPVTVTRTYDSRRKHELLDFGYGWSVGYQNVRLDESVVPGKAWSVVERGTGPLQQACFEPDSDRRITVTLPNGEVESFLAVASPQCVLALSGGQDVNLVFNAMPGTHSSLEQLSYGSLRIVNGELVDPGELEPVNPERYRLTTREGYQYIIDQSFGIRQVEDLNGNTLTYNPNGIVHSSGKAIFFNRDGSGRITEITDPSGEVIQYGYNTQGDLGSVTERSGDVSTYTYNSTHGLVDMFDPLGRKLIKNIYDASGRLIAQEDEDGNRTEFDHNIAGRQSIVTDRNGNTSVFYYDDRGNVSSQVDALGNTTAFAYDTNDNQLTKTDALGNVWTSTYNASDDQLTDVDPLGNTTTFAYNSRGQETTITDALNQVFDNSYDGNGNLLSIKNPAGNTTSNVLNAQGLVTEMTDALGNKVSYSYDSNGNKLTETNASGDTMTYTYDSNGNALTDSRQRTVNGVVVTEITSYEYDQNDRVIKTTDALGNVTRTEYNAAGQEVTQIDALGRRTVMAYDAYGNLTQTTYPDGSSSAMVYDAERNKTSETDRLGRTTTYSYDALNRLTQTTYADGSSTQTGYDAAGRVVSNTDALGNKTTYEYDAAGRRTAVVDANNHRSSMTYDAAGSVTQETDALSQTKTHSYNVLGQRIKTTFADTTSTSTLLDALSRKTGMTDQANISTTYAYDEQGRLTTVTDATGEETRYSYDEAGNKLSQTDAENRTTVWAYDALGRVTRRTLPMGQSESFTYDANGNRLSHTDFNGATHSYQYDINNRVKQINYADGRIENYQYDANGNRTQSSIADGGLTRIWVYQYDNLNRLKQETKPNGSTLVYSYDTAGNKTQLVTTLANGSANTTTYAYDKLNRLSSVTDSTGITGYGYDAVGNRSSISYPNGTSQTYTYDTLNRLTKLDTFDGNGALIKSYSYTLHPTGRRTQIDETGGRSTAYSYDTLYRLTAENITDVLNGNHNASYSYDKTGNRTQSIINGITTAYIYDANDRLTQTGGTTYSYDANGNTLSESLDGNTTTYTYNSKNHLGSTTKAGAVTNYRYNPEGIRHQQSDITTTKDYLVDQNRDYAQVLVELDNNTEAVSYSYGDDLISQTRNGASYFYHYDGLGSTRALSDSSGVLTDSYDYEAFGDVLAQTGTTENSYLFTGEQFDAGLDQYYLRARYYDQGVGRFTQQDTYMGNNADPMSLHKYAYGNADPVNYTDPTGHFGLASFGVANNIRFNLINLQIDTGFSILDASMNPGSAANNAGNNLLLGVASLGGPAAFKMMRLLSSKFRKACNSFEGDTLVSTEFGLKPISAIKIGDLVWAYDEESGTKTLQEVVHLIQGEGSKELVDIELMSGEVITTTSGHPFFVADEKDWLDAGELALDDVLLSFDGAATAIHGLKAYTEQARVYNLTVANDHTYFVGQSGVLAHNTSNCLYPLGTRDSHILVGEIHNKKGARASGFHHWPSAMLEGNRRIISRGHKDRYGVYKAKVAIYNESSPAGKRWKTKSSTMFPDEWTSTRVVSEINTAYLNALANGFSGSSGTWVGKTSAGFKIEGRIDANGFIHSAYPVF